MSGYDDKGAETPKLKWADLSPLQQDILRTLFGPGGRFAAVKGANETEEER